MRSTTPKVLHPMCGRPMLAYVLDAWASTDDGAAGGPPVIVYSPAVAAVTEAFAGRATFALQDEPRGTGDAVRAALAAVPDDAAEILVLSGDVPLVTGADLDAILEARRADDAAIALASVFAADPAPSSGVSCAAASGRSSGSSRPGMRRPRSSSATRRTPACTRSMPPGFVAGSEPSRRRR